MLSPQQRRKRNSTRVNLIIAAVFHGAIVFVVLFWAAREGVLGDKLKTLTVAIVAPEKKPEPEPPKPPPPPPPEPAPEEKPIIDETPKTVAPPPLATAPPPAYAPSAAAPPPASLPDFSFGDGAKPVETSSPAGAYKGLVEYTLRSNWERPENVADINYAAEVEIQVDSAGRIVGQDWKKASGDKRWDDSVRKAIASTTSLNRPPPAGFPGKVLVRFDVASTGADLFGQ